MSGPHDGPEPDHEPRGRRPVAVVTGASAGVGRAVVRRLAARGFDVGLIARGRAGLAAAAADVTTAGGRALVLPCDVADWHGVRSAAQRCEEELGPIELWCNVAMTTVFARAWDCDPAEIKRATEVTYLGQVHGILAALEHMRPRDRGRIVSVGSALAYVGIPLQSAYCGSKFAVRGFTESVRAELLADGSGVTIAQVHLPAVNTPQFGWCLSRMDKRPQPVPPIYEPDRAAAAIVSTALGHRPTRLLGSWNRLIVRGSGVFPEVFAHYAARTGVQSQQTDQPADPNRPSNLRDPVDDERDHGARGTFGDRANGVLDPSFVRSLPRTAMTIGVSVRDAVRTRVAGRPAPRRTPAASEDPVTALP